MFVVERRKKGKRWQKYSEHKESMSAATKAWTDLRLALQYEPDETGPPWIASRIVEIDGDRQFILFILSRG